MSRLNHQGNDKWPVYFQRCFILWLLIFWLLTSASFPQSEGSTPPAENAATNSSNGTSEETCPDDQTDCRESFGATLQLGLITDTFAAEELKTYLNPEDANSVQTEYMAGIRFGYRVLGKARTAGRPQLWIYGSAVYSIRSADVDCQANPNLALCQVETGQGQDPSDVREAFLFVLSEATALDSYFGLRWELATIAAGSGAPSHLYLKAEAGLLAVAGHTRSIERHQGAFGLTLTRGMFQGSYLELGYGTSGIYAHNANGRWKFDAMVVWGLQSGLSTFAQITVETDLSTGADSIRSFFGFGYDFSSFLPKNG